MTGCGVVLINLFGKNANGHKPEGGSQAVSADGGGMRHENHLSTLIILPDLNPRLLLPAAWIRTRPLSDILFFLDPSRRLLITQKEGRR
eukprot:6214079-Pleurochrysis_carterae.AAC.2